MHMKVRLVGNSLVVEMKVATLVKCLIQSQRGVLRIWSGKVLVLAYCHTFGAMVYQGEIAGDGFVDSRRMGYIPDSFL